MSNLSAEDVTATPSCSTAYVASAVVLATPGVTHEIVAQIKPALAAGDYWVFLLDAASLPSDGAATPKRALLVSHTLNVAEVVTFVGRLKWSAGCVVSLSTTGPGTLTIASAGMVVMGGT